MEIFRNAAFGMEVVFPFPPTQVLALVFWFYRRSGLLELSHVATAVL